MRVLIVCAYFIVNALAASVVRRQTISPSDVPPQCQSACATALNIQATCASISCLCTSATDSAIQGCANCAIPLEPNLVGTISPLISDYNAICSGQKPLTLPPTTKPTPPATPPATSNKPAPTGQPTPTAQPGTTPPPATPTTTPTSSPLSGGSSLPTTGNLTTTPSLNATSGIPTGPANATTLNIAAQTSVTNAGIKLSTVKFGPFESMIVSVLAILAFT